LKRSLGGEIIVLTMSTDQFDISSWQQRWHHNVTRHGREIWFETDDAVHDLRQLTGELETAQRIEIRRPSLEDVFLKLTGREIREEGPESHAKMPWRMRGGR
ncbi:MAG: ABC transporter ATP-binding protein, partial [Firmicutes bacterium]|nr:ABC transporter ATP-binding protein [Bacillota bacterium]